MNSRMASEPVHLFDMGEVQLPQGFRSAGGTANIQYWVGTPGRQALIQVRDGNGNVVREMSGPAEAGLHAIEWDLSASGSQPAQPGRFGRVSRVPPGSYAVVVTVGNVSSEGKLTVTR
jgi:hypothetical protein